MTMGTRLNSREGFALPLILMLLFVASISAMALTSVSTQQSRSATSLSSSVRALQAAESGAAFVVNALNSEDIAWPDDGEYEGADIGDVSDDLPSESPDDPNHGTASWWVESIEVDGNEATIRIVGEDPSDTSARTIQVVYEQGGPGGANAFESSLVGCSGVTFSGSAFTDSYDSSAGAYNAGTANHNGDITNLSGNISLTGSTVIKGDLNVSGNLSMSGSTSITRTTNVTGNITYAGNPVCPAYAVKAGGSITKPGAWWCPGSAPLMTANTTVTPAGGTCDPLNVNDFVGGQLTEATPDAGSYSAGTFSGSSTTNFNTDKNFSPSYNSSGSAIVNFATETVDQIFVNGNFSASGSSKIRFVAPTTPGKAGRVRIFVNGNFSLSGSAQFIIDAGVAVEIYTTGTVSLSGSVMNQNGKPTITQMVDGEPQTVPTLSIFTSYAGASGVTISGSAALHGSVYAPLTPVNVSGSGALYGAVRGKTVTSSGAGGIHYDEVLAGAQSGFGLEGGESSITEWSEVF